MASSFSFKVEGLDKLIGIFDQLPKQTQKELGNELQLTANEIKNGARRDAPTNEARLKQSISVTTQTNLTFEVVAQSFYAGYLEFGTKSNAVIPAGLESIAGQLKGPVAGQGNPMDALQLWVKQKGLAGTYSVKTRRRTGNKATKDQQDKQIAFLIWRKIKQFGIKPQPFFFTQLKPAEERLKRRLGAIIKSLIE